jgi:hypothetical protein
MPVNAYNPAQYITYIAGCGCPARMQLPTANAPMAIQLRAPACRTRSSEIRISGSHAIA